MDPPSDRASDSTGYSEAVFDHLRNPRNAGRIDPAHGEAFREHPACGDRLRIRVRLAGGIVEAIGFEAQACAGTIAAASVATELARGRPATEVRGAVDEAEIDRALRGLPPGKAHCARLAAEVLRLAVEASLAAADAGSGGRSADR